MKKKRIFRNQKGFTLIEIIAVLVILGILAAVAVPKYIDMQAVAKQGAARGQVAEMKGSLSQAYAKAFMTLGTAPTGVQVVSNTGLSDGVLAYVGTDPDRWGVTLTATSNNVNVNVSNRNGDANYNNYSYWNCPE